jgi:hypothetical protein
MSQNSEQYTQDGFGVSSGASTLPYSLAGKKTYVNFYYIKCLTFLH